MSVTWFRAMVAVSSTVILGCSPNTPAGSQAVSQPFRGQEVTLLVPQSLNLPSLWEILIQEWTSQSGASARFVEYDVSTDDIGKQIPADSSGGTLLLFPINRLPDLQDQLSPLPAQLHEFDSRDLFKGLRERVLTREYKLIANPISVPVLSCYYRADLLRTANRSAPETWEEYDDLVSAIGEWGPGLIAIEPLGSDFRASTFIARTLAYCKHPENYSVWFDLESGSPVLRTTGFDRALEMASKTWKRLAPESRSLSPADCRRLILEGKAAITLAFEPSDADLTGKPIDVNASKSDRIDGIEVGVCRLPGSRSVYNRNSKRWDTLTGKAVHAPALCGFGGLVSAVTVNSGPVEDSAAMSLLAALSSEDVFGRGFLSLPKSVCRESQTLTAPAWYGPELAAEEAGAYCDAAAQSLRDSQLVFELPMIGAAEFRRAISASIEPLLSGEIDHLQALDSMQKSFEVIVEQLGASHVRDSYRQGLGMSPLKK